MNAMEILQNNINLVKAMMFDIGFSAHCCMSCPIDLDKMYVDRRNKRLLEMLSKLELDCEQVEREIRNTYHPGEGKPMDIILENGEVEVCITPKEFAYIVARLLTIGPIDIG